MNKKTIISGFSQNKRLKAIIYKSIVTMVLLLMAFLLTRINTNPTNRLLETVKTSINHEYHIKDDSLRIYNRAKNIFDSTIESVPVLIQIINFHLL